MTPLVIPRENVNDETATLIAWSAPDGARVEAGQVVAQIETSKAVVDLHAPGSGTLRHSAGAGQEIPIGGEIGRIGDAAPEATPPPPPPPPAASGNGAATHALTPAVRRLVAEGQVDPSLVKGTGRGGRITKGDVLAHLAAPPPSQGPARLSRKAKELAERLGLDPSGFEGRGLIRSRDLTPKSADGLAAAPPAAPPAAPSAAAPPPPAPHRPVAASGVPTRVERLPRAKRTEGNYLRSGFESTLASVVTVACPTKGLRAALGDRASALIVAEAAKLLRKYPAFNAFHDDGSIHYYEQVNVGFAVDAGRGLKVAVVRDADAKGVNAIADEMRELVVAYLGDALGVEALAGGTFTVTDLSGEGVSAFHPLINRGQSAILGVGAEVAGVFHLILAFDHQVSEGRAAARFLGELRDRLAHYESASLKGGEAIPTEEPRCSRCQAGYAELAADGHFLLQSVRGDGSPRLICRPCWEGWA